MTTSKDWDERFISVARLVGTWSTCLKTNRHIGAVIVKNNRILATGYNGAPSGITNCLDRKECNKCVSENASQECCYGVHAEQNAILQAAKLGISIENSTLYCTHSPCSVCAKSIINSGIKRIVFENIYPDKFALDMLHEANVEVINITHQNEEKDNV